MATPLQTNTDKLTTLKEKANNLPDQNPPAQLQEKTVTPTKEGLSVVPDSGFDGMSKVTVNGDANLVPENIKEGVSIFGILGSLSSLDLTFHEVTSTIVKTGTDLFADTYQTINLTSLTYLPLIIIVQGGSVTTLPNDQLYNSIGCAVYVRYNYYSDHYVGIYYDNKVGSCDLRGEASYTKNADGTYNINDIYVRKETGPMSDADPTAFTAILIGRAAE